MGENNVAGKYLIDQEESENLTIYKFILTIMVVFIHSYSTEINFASKTVTFNVPIWLETIKYTISQVISRSAVPAFFLISAILLYRKPYSWKMNCIKKLKTLALPFFIINSVWIVVSFVAQQIPYSRDFFSKPEHIIANWNIADFIDGYLGYKTNFPFLYPLWFLRDLLVLNILSTAIWKLIDKLPNITLVISLISWIIIGQTGLFFLDIQGVCFWILGGVIVKKNINLNTIKKIPLLYLFIAYSLLITLCLLTNETQFHGPIHRITFATGVIFWFAVTYLLKNMRIRNVLLYLSTYSFSIYIFHEFITSIFKAICGKIFPLTSISQLLQYIFIPFVVITICIIFSRLFKSIFPNFYCLLIGNRNK